MSEKYHITYLVATSQGRWGRGKTMTEALRKADALNSKGGRRRGITTIQWFNCQGESDRLTQEDIEYMANDPHLHITGYEAGQYMEPFVSSYGGPVHRGMLVEMEQI